MGESNKCKVRMACTETVKNKCSYHKGEGNVCKHAIVHEDYIECTNIIAKAQAMTGVAASLVSLISSLKKPRRLTK